MKAIGQWYSSKKGGDNMKKGFQEIQRRELQSAMPWVYWFGWYMGQIDIRWLNEIGSVYMY